MKETIKVVCYKSKTLSNGEHPIMVCVSKDGKRKYQSLGISIKEELWDFKKNGPNAERFTVAITYTDYDIILILKSNRDEYSCRMRGISN